MKYSDDEYPFAVDLAILLYNNPPKNNKNYYKITIDSCNHGNVNNYRSKFRQRFLGNKKFKLSKFIRTTSSAR